MPQAHPKRTSGVAPQLNFVVTDAMIATAVPADSAHCMISDGLRAALPHARGVATDLATIRYTDSRTGRRYIYLTPPEGQYALLQFDHGIKPKSFTVKNHAVQIIEPQPKRKKKMEPGSEQIVPATLPEAGETQVEALSPSISETAEQRGEAFSPSLSETAEQLEAALSPSISETVESEPVEPRPYRRATVIPNPAGGGTVPIKVNGSPLPMGPLGTGKGSQRSDLARRTGRIRKFGLRVMGRIDLGDLETPQSFDS